MLDLASQHQGRCGQPHEDNAKHHTQPPATRTGSSVFHKKGGILNNPYSAPDAWMNEDEDDFDNDDNKPRFFSIKGRIGRLRYLAYAWGATTLAAFVVGIIAAILIPATGSTPSTGVAFMLGTLIYTPWIIMARRRLHDLDQSGWLALLIFVPFVFILFGLYLTFAPGTDGTNRFGPKPAPNSVVAWLFIVTPLVLISIVAAIAIPAYQRYNARAKQLHDMQTQTQQEPAPQDQQSQQ